MSSHTPGPWEMRQNYAPLVYDSQHALISIPASRDEEGAELANAHLIATAPELLEALEEIQDGPGFCSACAGYYYDGNFCHSDDCKLAALIAKAKGETDV